jgi:uncharacterized protein (TIGR03437 family)
VTAGTQSAFGTAGFVSKISADGATLEYSTYLRGHQSAPGYTVFNEPALFETQNWIAGIALDSAGDAIITGGTRATDFPTVNPSQSASAGQADAFAAVISADGSTLKYSTYLGGSSDDGGLAVSLDPQGNLILAGETWSGDFPIASGPPLALGVGGAFVAKLTVPTTPVVTSVLNGASFQPGIEAGSWATIQGSNLANITRTWQASDFTGDDLPTSLSGVSVTIDGEPAFVEYISPTQINVLAPDDATAGAVQVQVTEAQQTSNNFSAPKAQFAPAFFTIAGGAYVAAQHADYSLVGAANLLPGVTTTPAKPGETILLYGTGFGPTNPPLPTAQLVTAAEPLANSVQISIGGLAATASFAGLVSPGLYQFNVTVPNLPNGDAAVLATIGGVATETGLSVTVQQ